MPVLELAAACTVTFGTGAALGHLVAKRKNKLPPPRPLASPQTRGRIHTNTFWADRHDAVVLVDPYSTGSRLAAGAQQRGYKIIRLHSCDWPQTFLDEHCRTDVELETTLIFNKEDPQATVREIMGLNYHITAVMVGGEAGVECYDIVSSALKGIPSNGLDLAAARRDKYLMGEQVRRCGLRAVKQRECRAWQPEGFDMVTKELGLNDGSNGRWCVLKPTKSAGSDGVFIAKNVAEAQEYFARILNAENVFFETNQTVLVQEFLKGREYVVDSVSVEGEHKAVAIWEYDKRPCNGAPFVYYGMRLYQSEDGAREEALVNYMHGVLDALGVRQGPSHGEIIWLEDEGQPCLVEVGCRPHGGDGTFVDMVEPTIGYSQVSVLLDVLDKPYRFRRLPKRPAKFSGLALEVCLVSKVEGTLHAYPQLNKVRRLPSFHTEMLKVPVKGRLEKTVDFQTTPGSFMLVHADREQVERDYNLIIQMCEDSSFYLLANFCSPKFNTRSM